MADVLTLIGVEGVKDDLRRIHAMGLEELSVNLKKGGLYIQGESQRVVPIDTGALRNSARTFYIPGSGNRFRDTAGRFTKQSAPLAVQVQYSTAYAIFVHEDLFARHAEGKIAKFLERTVNEKIDNIRRIVARGSL